MIDLERKAGKYIYIPSDLELQTELFCQRLGGVLLPSSTTKELFRRSLPIKCGDKTTSEQLLLQVVYDRCSPFYNANILELYPKGLIKKGTALPSLRELMFETDLDEEVFDDLTAGMVLDPSFIPGSPVKKFEEGLSLAVFPALESDLTEEILPVPSNPFEKKHYYHAERQKRKPYFIAGYSGNFVSALLDNQKKSEVLDSLGVSWTGSLVEDPKLTYVRLQGDLEGAGIQGCREMSLGIEIVADRQMIETVKDVLGGLPRQRFRPGCFGETVSISLKIPALTPAVEVVSFIERYLTKSFELSNSKLPVF